MQAKENTRILLLQEKVQVNVYKISFDKDYLISIHDISNYSSI